VPKYKVTKVFLTDADSKEEAIAKITANPGELLEFVSVIEQPQKNDESGSGSGGGWGKSLVKQLTGK
jgi:hypothetical protein